ncbi:uncharacterized protein [Eurosta solidaginis]|uniref:uncharacterized protein n=1 Tax=Eurosta solidaginis TaxID=178769 RepID=UPI003531358C
MLLKEFIILLLCTSTTGEQLVRGLRISLHATQAPKERIEEIEENLKGKQVQKYLFAEKSEKTDNEDLNKNSTQLSSERFPHRHERKLAHRKARESSQPGFMSTQPQILFAEEPQTFSIIEQLKLDEIRDGEAALHFDQSQLKAGKKKRKKKIKNKRKPIGEETTVFYTQLTTKKPHYYYSTWTTTKKPKKVKYFVHKKHALKKKKKEYLNHLKQVLYPFVKFIAFFTVLNPFTLKVFLFTLISPVVFGFLGFMALSLLVKPTLHLIFDVKKHVNQIKAKKWREKKRRESWHRNRRPITIHKHYYKNVVLPQTPPKVKWQPKPLPHPNWPEWVRSDEVDLRPTSQKPVRHAAYRPIAFGPSRYSFNPILPDVADKIEDWNHSEIQLDRFKPRNQAQIVASERLPAVRTTILRPLSALVNRRRSPLRNTNKYSVTPLRVSSEMMKPPFL